jgi:acyl-CoA thioesterase FadM
MIFRTFIHMACSRRRSALGIHDVGTVRFRVLPTDLDVLGHMNNGIYFSIMDVGRTDLLIRAGVWAKFSARGYYPVLAGETGTFRKSLRPWQRFDLETRVIGYDEKAVFVEQRFVVDGEIYASAVTKARFLKKSGGTLSTAELADVVGIDITTLTPPAWVTEWSTASALPNTRTAAPSVWS